MSYLRQCVGMLRADIDFEYHIFLKYSGFYLAKKRLTAMFYDVLVEIDTLGDASGLCIHRNSSSSPRIKGSLGRS